MVMAHWHGNAETMGSMAGHNWPEPACRAQGTPKEEERAGAVDVSHARSQSPSCSGDASSGCWGPGMHCQDASLAASAGQNGRGISGKLPGAPVGLAGRAPQRKEMLQQ